MNADAIYAEIVSKIRKDLDSDTPIEWVKRAVAQKANLSAYLLRNPNARIAYWLWMKAGYGNLWVRTVTAKDKNKQRRRNIVDWLYVRGVVSNDWRIIYG